jgi:lipocalin-like protein
MMKHGTAIAIALSVALFVAAGGALAQSAKSLVGAWTLVNIGDTFGKDPKGTLLFDASGRYVLTITRSDLPKFASNSRTKGTSDENKAVVGGSISHFGRYKVNEKDKTFTLDIESSTYPNFNGTSQTRPFRLDKDQLSYKVATPSAGGQPGEVIWKRLK